jgi:hypothetical protein
MTAPPVHIIMFLQLFPNHLSHFQNPSVRTVGPANVNSKNRPITLGQLSGYEPPALRSKTSTSDPALSESASAQQFIKTKFGLKFRPKITGQSDSVNYDDDINFVYPEGFALLKAYDDELVARAAEGETLPYIDNLVQMGVTRNESDIAYVPADKPLVFSYPISQ